MAISNREIIWRSVLVWWYKGGIFVYTFLFAFRVAYVILFEMFRLFYKATNKHGNEHEIYVGFCLVFWLYWIITNYNLKYTYYPLEAWLMKGRPSSLFAPPYLLFLISCTIIDYKYVLVVWLLNSNGRVEEFLRIGEGWGYDVTQSQLTVTFLLNKELCVWFYQKSYWFNLSLNCQECIFKMWRKKCCETF